MKGLQKVEKEALKNGDVVREAITDQMRLWKDDLENGVEFWHKAIQS